MLLLAHKILILSNFGGTPHVHKISYKCNNFWQGSQHDYRGGYIEINYHTYENNISQEG